MRGLAAYAGMMLRLQFRYRLAVFYSFLFPLIFLAAFRIFYRWDWIQSSGVGHLGELLVVAILGGTCFGLPDRKSTRLNSSHTDISRMPSSA